jgi:hypothetical protein
MPPVAEYTKKFLDNLDAFGISTRAGAAIGGDFEIISSKYAVYGFASRE